jgi:DNA-binding XRE family transcriptional regulator
VTQFQFTAHRAVTVNPALRHTVPVPSKREVQKQLSIFGANVRRERMARGITQERLAEQTDLNIRTLQKIEAGQTNILITTAVRIQRAIECPWERLVAKV